MFLRKLKLAVQNLYRNFWLSMATIVIILLSLFSVSLLFALSAVSQEAVSVLEDKINVSIYLKPEVGLQKAREIKMQIENYDEVEAVFHIAKEEALESFRQKHADNELIQRSLEEIEGNPLGDTLIIKAYQTSDYPVLIDKIGEDDFSSLVENKKFNENYKGIIGKLDQLSENISWVMLGLTALFVIISTLIIINTIRITIYTYREEIGIMKLVGATKGFIRSPFLMQAFFYGVVAWGIHLVILFPVMRAFQPYVANFMGTGAINLAQYFTQNFIVIFGAELLGVLFLTLFSSAVAMRKYLRV